MEPLGMSVLMVGFFVGFGLLVGILFGFFGMGGTFLVTPALLVLGYSPPVAVGSGLAFVFGTAVNSALRHRAFGQVDFTLAWTMTFGMTIGLWLGMQTLWHLEQLGAADSVISAGYIGLLGTVGFSLLWDAGTGETDDGPVAVASVVQSLEIPPTASLPGGAAVSMWALFAVGLGVGVLSGLLGVGGGFLLIPAMIYGFGVPAAVAIGTDIVQIALSSLVGTFMYAEANAVNVPVVAALLGGSALGARIGAGATRLVDEAAITQYFGATLLVGSVAVWCRQLSTTFSVEILATGSVILLSGGAVFISGVIIVATIETLRGQRDSKPLGTHTD